MSVELSRPGQRGSRSLFKGIVSLGGESSTATQPVAAPPVAGTKASYDYDIPELPGSCA